MILPINVLGVKKTPSTNRKTQRKGFNRSLNFGRCKPVGCIVKIQS
jgi:hypothetical protein